ncbi:sodium:solute symporter family protein [Aurantivibrio plasticivorans]
MSTSAITVIVYLLVVTGVGTLLARRNKSSSDWATGAGGMGVIMIAAGIAGTRIGGAGSYGVAGDVMNTGIWNVWYGVNTFLALALVGAFFAIPYRRLGLTTVAELFGKRYGKSRSGWFTSLCVQTEYLVVNVIEPLLIGVIVSNILGIPLVVGIFIGAFVIIAATASSGLKGTSSTNIIHCFVIIFGLATVGIVVAGQLGGWGAVIDKANAALAESGKDSSSWWSFIGLGWFPIIAMFFSATIHTPAASVYVNYSSSAKRESILLPAFLLAGVVAATMPFLSAVIGVEALAKYGSNSGIAGYNSITKIAIDAGPFIGGVALAAVLAALISSGGPILLASSTMFVNDWIPSSKDYSPDKKLKAYRITAVIYGLVAAVIACYFGYVVGTASVLKWLLLGYAMVVPPAIAIGYIFYVKATTESSVYWGIVVGYALGLIAWSANNLVFKSESDVAAYFTTLIPLVLIPNMSLWAQAEKNEHANKAIIRSFVLLAAGLMAVFAISKLAGVSSDDLIIYLAALAAPLIIGKVYLRFMPATTNEGVFWGVLLAFTGIVGTWFLNTFYVQTDMTMVLYAAIGISLVVIPTVSLATLKALVLNEREQEFYRLLKTPA